MKVRNFTARDAAALRLVAKAEKVCHGDRRVASTTMTRLEHLGYVVRLGIVRSSGPSSRWILTADGHAQLAILDRGIPVEWEIWIDGVPYRRSPLRRYFHFGRGISYRSRVDYRKLIIRLKFPKAKVEVRPSSYPMGRRP